MNDSVSAAPARSARTGIIAGIRENSRRILRQVINRYTLRLSAITGMRLTPRLAIRGGVSMLWLSLCLLFAITSRPLWK